MGEGLLTPAQQDVLDQLGAGRDERPVFDAGLCQELRAELEAGLAPVAARLDEGEKVFVNKHDLGRVHGCEELFHLEQEAGFEWSPATARGAVTHKAIELSVTWRGEAAPADLVEEAIARLEAGDANLADWLQTCSEADRAELRVEAGRRLIQFLECWPPLRKQWWPSPETSIRAELCGDRFVLRGKVDLSLGRSEGTTAGKVFVDFKTGGVAAHHRDDLRFYALLETLRRGVPPRLLATSYLDQGRLDQEPVTVDHLYAAAARVIDGVRRIVELGHGSTPVRRAGPACRWCPAIESCPDADVGP
ncbi:MAG: hypothetical protein JJLCMIEE_02912 [Acidimicrobiales bacterium]|nr:hypothetical protein [Acidimicrobiales bacterium]RIK04411.1 MAG: hypothetical protein DCC48_13615 [Acidobacteriota bacterium]